MAHAQEKAFDETTGKLRQAKEHSVNKVGHGEWGLLCCTWEKGRKEAQETRTATALELSLLACLTFLLHGLLAPWTASAFSNAPSADLTYS